MKKKNYLLLSSLHFTSLLSLFLSVGLSVLSLSLLKSQGTLFRIGPLVLFTLPPKLLGTIGIDKPLPWLTFVQTKKPKLSRGISWPFCIEMWGAKTTATATTRCEGEGRAVGGIRRMTRT